jgi:DNA-nicking Smr family endonuclease
LSKLKLDLHPIYNKGELIDNALINSFKEAEENKIDELEIIYGKGSGQLKKKVLRFLDQEEVRSKYHRITKDVKNSGRAFVYFRWK